MIDIYISELKAVVGSITNTTGFAPVIAFQPISTAISKHFAKNGGNALGVSPTDGPLMREYPLTCPFRHRSHFILVIQFNWAWASAADDTRVIGAIENILHRSTAAAQAMGLLNDYIYLNYAAPDQQPFAGYGPKNLQRLQQIQRNYDPEGVFEVLQPGYFKLNSGRSSQ